MEFGTIIEATSGVLGIITSVKELLANRNGSSGGASQAELQDGALLETITAYLPSEFMQNLGTQYSAQCFPTELFDTLDAFAYTLGESPTAYFHDYELAEKYRVLKGNVTGFLQLLCDDSSPIPNKPGSHSMFNTARDGNLDWDYYNSNPGLYEQQAEDFHVGRISVYEAYWDLLHEAQQKCYEWGDC